MSSIKMDLSKFKYVKSDAKSTTLQHKDGHTVTLAHNGLSQANQNALKALSGIASQAQTPLQSDANKHQNQGMAPTPMAEGKRAQRPIHDQVSKFCAACGGKMAEGSVASRKMYAEAGPVTPKANVPEALNPEASPDILAPNLQATAPVPQPLSPVQKEYNQLISATPNVPGGATLNPKSVFVPGGPDPENFNPDLWQMAEQRAQMANSQEEAAKQAAIGQKLKENEVRARAGLKPVPMPGLGLQLDQANAEQNAADQTGAPVEDKVPMPASVAPSLSGAPQEQQKQKQGIPATTEGLYQEGFEKQMEGLAGTAAVQKQLAGSLSQPLQEQAEAAQQANDAYIGVRTQLQGHQDDLKQAILQNEIDPNKFWTGDKQGNGGHSKIMAGLGMILAGFNPTSNPNAAINLLKMQMDMNLTAQAKNLESKHNLYRYNLEQFRNERDAADMTRLQLKDIAVAKMAEMQNKVADPAAKANLQLAQGQLEQQYAPIKMKMEMRRTMMQLMGEANGPGNGPTGPQQPAAIEHMMNYMDAIDPGSAKEYRERYVKGLGLSSNATVPQPVRDSLTAHQDLDRLTTQVLQFAKQHSGSIDPTIRAAGGALMNELQSKLRTAEDQGVYKKSDAEFLIDTLGHNPANFSANWTTSPRVKQIQDIKRADYQNLLRSAGFSSQAQMPSQQQQAIPEGQTIINKATGQRMQYHNGQWQPIK